MSYALDVFVSTSSQLASACANAASGHVIKIAAGSYDGPFSLNGKNNVTLTSYNGTVFLRGNANPATNGFAVLSINNSSNITITGLKFHRSWGNFASGVEVHGSGNTLTISNCEFYDIGWTQNKLTMPNSSKNANALIIVGSTATPYSNITLSGNTIHDCITGYSENMSLAGNIDGFLIENNHIYNNTNIGIDCQGHFSWTGAPANVNYSRNGVVRYNVVHDYQGPPALDAAAGIYIDGGSSIILENNLVYNYKVGLDVGCETPNKTNSNNIVRNNVAYNCDLAGLFLGSNQSTSVCLNTKVTGNTFFKNGFGVFDNGQIAFQNNSGSIVKNNIFYPTNGRFALVQMNGTSTSTASITHNLYYRDNGNISNLYFNINGDNQAIKQNPLFVNAGLLNFHVQSSSPAINAGDPAFTPAAGEVDLDGQARMLNGRVDIGVDEVLTGTPPPPAPTNLSATAVSTSQINLSWSASTGATSYSVERSLTSGGTFTQIVAGLTTTSYNNTGLSPSTTYFYRVKASNGSGTSSPSAQASATTQSSPNPTTITIDGNASDWASIGTIATNGTGGLSSLKAADDATYLYVLAQGSSISTHYQLYIDTDNNNTGGAEYNDTAWPSTGFNYMVEDGDLYQYSGNGTSWAWTFVGTITAVKNTTVLEARLTKSSLGALSGTIRLAVASVNSGWSAIGFVPASGGSGAPYTLGSSASARIAFGNEEPAVSFEESTREGSMKVYPNPSRGTVQVEYTTKTSGLVSLDVVDLSGKVIQNSERSIKPAGHYQRTLHIEAGGMYIIKLVKDATMECKLVNIEP